MPKPRELHKAELRAAKAGYGSPVKVTASEAADLLATGDYRPSVGLDLAASHYRAPGGLHLSRKGPGAGTGDGLATGTDGEAIVADAASDGSSPGPTLTGDAGGGADDGGSWSLHVDRADPHAGVGGLVAHVAQDVPCGGTVLLVVFTAITAGAAYFYRRGR